MKKRSVFWAPGAQRSYRLAWRYIAKDSRTISNQVFDEIDDAIDALVVNPTRYPTDVYRKLNAGDFRAFEMKGYRISYQITEEHILIVRFRHVKKKPRQY